MTGNYAIATTRVTRPMLMTVSSSSYRGSWASARTNRRGNICGCTPRARTWRTRESAAAHLKSYTDSCWSGVTATGANSSTLEVIELDYEDDDLRRMQRDAAPALVEACKMALLRLSDMAGWSPEPGADPKVDGVLEVCKQIKSALKAAGEE